MIRVERCLAGGLLPLLLLGCEPGLVSRFVELPKDPAAHALFVATDWLGQKRYDAFELGQPNAGITSIEVTEPNSVRVQVRPHPLSLAELGVTAGPLLPGEGNPIPQSALGDWVRVVSAEEDSGWLAGKVDVEFDNFRSPALPPNPCRLFHAESMLDLWNFGDVLAVAPLAGEEIAVLQKQQLSVVDASYQVAPLAARFPALEGLRAIDMKLDAEGRLWFLGANCDVSRLSVSGALSPVARYTPVANEICSELTLLPAGSEAPLVLTTTVGLVRLLLTSSGAADWHRLATPNLTPPYRALGVGVDALLVVGNKGDQAAVYQGDTLSMEALPMPTEIELYPRSPLIATALGTIVSYNSFSQVDFMERVGSGRWSLGAPVVTDPIYALAPYGDGFVASGEYGGVVQFDPKRGHCAPQERVVNFLVNGMVPLGPDRFALFGRTSHKVAIVRALEGR